MWTLVAAFQYLPACDVLLTLPTVAKAWGLAAESPELWTALVARDFFQVDYSSEAIGKTTYRELLQRVKNPEKLIRMQQGVLSIYSLASGAILNLQDERFASSARFCLTASGRLVIAGGKQSLGVQCYLYSPEEQLFTALPQLREHREYHGMCLWGSAIVVSGGYEMRSEMSEVYVNSAELLTVGGSWKPMANMIEPRAYHTLVPMRSQIYAVAGMNSSGYLDTIECWENAIWKDVSVHLPEAISDPTVKTVGGNTLLVLGGMHEFGFLNSAFEIDFTANTCKTYTLPVEIYTGNNCITRQGTEFVLFNTLKEVVRLTYERGVRVG